MRKRWLVVLVSIAVATAAALAVLQSDFRVYVMPGYVLRQALLESGEQLRRRFDGNPLLHMAQAMSEEGQQARLHIKGEGIEADGLIQFSPRTVSGSVSWDEGTLEGRFCADGDSLALASPQLTKDQWFGIAYDTFAEDISQIPLISWILTDGMLKSWEDGLDMLRQRILTEWKTVPVPDLSAQTLSRLTMAIPAMKKDVRRTVITVGKETVPCYRIMAESGDSLLETAGLLPKGEEGQFSGTFYLNDGQIILMELSVRINEGAFRIHGETEENWEISPITVAWSADGEEWNRVRTESRRSGTVLTERWQIQTGKRERDVFYSWEKTTGEGAVWDQNGRKGTLYLQLQPRGFRLETENFPELAAVLKPAGIPEWIKTCEIALSPGENGEKPAFRRPNEWTMEDLLTILEGLGGLLQIPLL